MGSRVFRESDWPGIRALADSEAGLTTDEFARKLGITTASLPPVVNGWNRRARTMGLTFSNLMTTTKRPGVSGRVYSLTSVGREFVAKELSKGALEK